MKAVVLAGLLVIAPELAFAAGGGHGHPSIKDTLPYWANFLLFVSVLFYLLKGVVVSGWVSRRAGLQESVEAGARELEAAEARLAEAQKTYDAVSEQVAAIEKEIAENSEQEAARIIDEANQKAKRTEAQALDSIQAERRSLEVAIRRELAESVIEQARERISKELDSQTDEALRNSALQGLSGLVQ